MDVGIALTGWGQDNNREQSREAGNDGHLVKPANFPELETMLGQVRRGEVPESGDPSNLSSKSAWLS